MKKMLYLLATDNRVSTDNDNNDEEDADTDVENEHDPKYPLKT